MRKEEFYMLSRHEEKYIIDYKQYAMLRHKAQQLLTPDPHGICGNYTITSLYFDDFKIIPWMRNWMAWPNIVSSVFVPMTTQTR